MRCTSRVEATAASWASFRHIPYVQKRAVIVSEDSTFYFHHGMDISEIQDAIHKGLTTGEKARVDFTLTVRYADSILSQPPKSSISKSGQVPGLTQ